MQASNMPVPVSVSLRFSVIGVGSWSALHRTAHDSAGERDPAPRSILFPLIREPKSKGTAVCEGMGRIENSLLRLIFFLSEHIHYPLALTCDRRPKGYLNG